MKLIKLLSLVIVLLLSCFISYCQNYSDYFSTGDTIVSDSVKVCICDIKKVNVGLIERKYYIKITNEQDSIICLKDNYILEQNKVITDMQQRIINETNLNNKLKEDYNKQKNKTLIAGGIAGGLGACLLGTIVTIILIK